MKRKPPSVTTVLRDVGLVTDLSRLPEETLELKRRLGSDVHRLCKNPDLRARLRSSDNPAFDYARQFARWLLETNAKVLRSEFPIRGSLSGHRYTGRCDLEFEWKGERWIADIKTGSVEPWHRIQLAAYFWQTNADKAGLLILRPSSAKLLHCPYVRTKDWRGWNACLDFWYCRQDYQ